MFVIAFTFPINPSFRRYSHPITIPITYNDKLRKTKLGQREYIIIYPRGETLKANMYHGRPEQDKEYYRLTVPKRNQRLPKYLQIGDSLIVVLVRSYGTNYAILEYIHKQKTRL